MERRQVLPPSVGTILKISIQADLDDAHMVDVDFSCRFFRKPMGDSITIAKEDMIYVSDDEYIAIVDTTLIGTGEYYVEFTADIPDNNIPSGIRKEVVTAPTGIKVQ